MIRRRINIGMVWRASAFVLVALAASCGTAEDPVLPTPRPTFTPSLEPSITDTRVFNASPTPTIVQAAFVTSGPTPTALIGDLPTRPLFTITPTFVNYVAGTLQIEYFTTNATSVKPGDKLTLYWSTKGVDKAVIYRLDSSGKRGQVWNVNKAGSLDVQTQTDDRTAAQFLLSIGDDKTHLDQTLTVPVQCTNVWFFDPQPSGCPVATPIISTEVQQTFERGQMIWVQDQLRIYVLFNDGQQPAWATYPDEFKDGQTDHDPAIQPPSGFFQPIRGFGLVWRTRERVRARLGWATQTEVPAQGAYQGDATVDNGAMYIRVKDGNILALFNKGASWKLITP